MPLTAPIAITHVTLVPMHTPQHLLDHTVLIADGRIRALGPAAEVDVRGAEVIDGSDRYLMPGLADMHVHALDPSAYPLYLANGVTQVRNMWGSSLHLAWEQAVQRGDLPGPHVATTSPIVDGPGMHGRPVWPGSHMVRTPAEAATLVERFARRGYRQIKAYQWLTHATLASVCEAAKRANVRVTGHCPDGVTFEEAIGYGMSCFEHLTGIAAGHLLGNASYPSLRDPASRNSSPEAIRLVAEQLDFDALKRLAAQMAEQQVWNCPTVVVWRASAQRLDEALADPDLRYLPPGLVRGWSAGLAARARSLSMPEQEWLGLARGRVQANLRIVSLLRDAGAPILLGTDHPNPFVVPGFSIHHELANLVEAGLTPYAALRAGTYAAAQFLGEDDEWGSLRVGQRADLLLLRSDPLANVGALRQLDLVCSNGVVFRHAELQRLLEERVERSANPTSAATPRLDESAGGSVIRQGVLGDRLNGAELGRTVYRHTRGADGEVLVEERVQSFDRSRSARVRLAADYRLIEGEWRTRQPPLGEDVLRIDRASGGYDVQRVEMDGYTATGQLIDERQALIPTSRLLVSIAGCLAEMAVDQAELRAISVDADDVCGVPMSIQHPHPGNADWELRIEHPSQANVERYTLGERGALLHMQEGTWMGLHELTAVDSEP